MKIDDLLKRFQWEQIPNTNGRFTLSQQETLLSVEALLGSEEVEIKQYPSAHPQEMIHVVELEDGGLICYERKDASFLHTLNSQNMFKRKQWELGIISFSPRQVPDDSQQDS
ncbi:hypothetical protein [Gimesia aquarii]|uniref:Uncharacterized protein n=1 Tax=Gimesia aquarii TaxID=2527964 RepID=A0A517WS10_9PLAN|nr:hypothetical protein [Gimesia aquarii]QDU08047.1 hypothetical protein V202x_14100 [Gimesia aquarii]